MIGIQVSITRYVSDEPQPGMVECEFYDADHRCWKFVEKTPILSWEDLQADTSYPRLGVIECAIVSRRMDTAGRPLITIDTLQPDGVESTDNQTRFEVLPKSLVEWEWGTNTLRPWDPRNTDRR